MGACFCCNNQTRRHLSVELDEAGIRATQDINAHMKVEAEIENRTRKLLLLGAGSSGKSTLLKQMRYLYIYKRGYPQDELSKYKSIVYENLIAILGTLCTQCIEHFQYDNDDENLEHIQKLITADIKSQLLSFDENSEFKDCLLQIWNDSGIKKTFERRHEFVLMDNASYLLENIERIIDDNYLPTFQDVIYTRSVTTGITKENFIFETRRGNKEMYELVDVGGQRTERRKWIQCFDDVLGIIFCIALSGYDQVLWEDNKVNKFEEALDLLYKMCTDKKYKRISKAKYIIFLNKRDLFRQKLDKVPFKYKHEFQSSDYDEIIEWIKTKICSFDENRAFYFNVTCATDTDDVDRVFRICHDIVIRNAVANGGFL